MKEDDLNNIWVCSDCKTTFVFTADIEDHKRETGHAKIVQTNLDAFGESINKQSDHEWRKSNR